MCFLRFRSPDPCGSEFRECLLHVLLLDCSELRVHLIDAQGFAEVGLGKP